MKTRLRFVEQPMKKTSWGVHFNDVNSYRGLLFNDVNLYRGMLFNEVNLYRGTCVFQLFSPTLHGIRSRIKVKGPAPLHWPIERRGTFEVFIDELKTPQRSMKFKLQEIWNPYPKLECKFQETTNHKFGLRSMLEECCLSFVSLSNGYEKCQTHLSWQTSRTKKSRDWKCMRRALMAIEMPDTRVMANVSDQRRTRRECIRHAHMTIDKPLFEDACARARLRSSLEPKWLRKNITIIECKYNTSYMHLQHKRKTRTHTGCLSRRRFRTLLGPTCFLTRGTHKG